MSDNNESQIPPVPYLNDDFLNSPAARTIRMLAEYLEPADRLRRARIRDTIVFFGSARSGSPEHAAQQLAEARDDESRTRAETAVKLARYYGDAVELARRLTEWAKALTAHHDFIICSGGSGGMMEAANRGAVLAGGKTIGFNIQLPHEQAVNQYIPPELVFNFHYFFMRKFWFVYLAKALVVFPGGFGTMDEFFEVITLIQTAKPRKTMPVVLYGTEYWNDIINFDAFVRWGTVSAKELEIFYRTDSVDDAYQLFDGPFGSALFHTRRIGPDQIDVRNPCRRLVIVSCLLVAGSLPIHAQTSCDRACLIGIADSYFAALAAHDLSKAPIAPKLRLFEKCEVKDLKN